MTRLTVCSILATVTFLSSCQRNGGSSAVENRSGKLTEDIARSVLEEAPAQEEIIEGGAEAIQCGEKAGWWTRSTAAHPMFPSEMVNVIVLTPEGQKRFFPSNGAGLRGAYGFDNDNVLRISHRSRRKILTITHKGQPIPSEGLEGDLVKFIGTPQPETRYVRVSTVWKWTAWPEEVRQCGFTTRDQYIGDKKAIAAYTAYRREEYTRKNNPRFASKGTLVPVPEPPKITEHDMERNGDFTLEKVIGKSWRIRQSGLVLAD